MNLNQALTHIEDQFDPYNDKDISEAWTVINTALVKLLADSQFLSELKKAGVDNWEGYSIACRALRGNEECEACGEPATQNLDAEPLCDDCFEESSGEDDADANDVEAVEQ